MTFKNISVIGIPIIILGEYEKLLFIQKTTNKQLIKTVDPDPAIERILVEISLIIIYHSTIPVGEVFKYLN